MKKKASRQSAPRSAPAKRSGAVANPVGPAPVPPFPPFPPVVLPSPIEQAHPPEEQRPPGEPIDDEIIVITRVGKGGCMKCSPESGEGDEGRNPYVEGDLEIRQKRPARVQPECDDTLKSRFLLNFFWKNRRGAQFSGDLYQKIGDDASVLSIVENFDNLVDLVRAAAGAVTTLPQNLTAGGVKQVDNIARDLFRRLAEIFSGKPDVDKLIGSVGWEFLLPAGATIRIRHAQEFETYARDRGTYLFRARCFIDSTEVTQLEHKYEAGPNNAQPTVIDPRIEGKEATLSLPPGLHTLKIFKLLQAGHGGIDDPNLRASIEAAIAAAQTAVTRVITAAAAAISALTQGNPVPASIATDLQLASGSVLDAAINALSALFGLIRNIGLESKGLVKLYTTSIEVTCAADEEANQQQ